MDNFDKDIINILQVNAKISITDLSKKIGLSATATSERIKKLERDGIITGYSAMINGDLVGKGLTAFVTIPVGELSIKQMEERLIMMPEILECHKVTGDACFLVKVKAKSPSDLEKIIDSINTFAKNTYTYLVLSTSKETTVLEV